MEIQQTFIKDIGQLFLERGQTIAVGESVTSGLLQLAFSQMQDASRFYKGGATAFTLPEKVKFWKVDPTEAEKNNCVSAFITETIALNTQKTFETDWAIATTGYATPVPESNFELYAFYCIRYQDRIMAAEKLELHPKTKAIDAQNYYTETVLSQLRNMME